MITETFSIRLTPELKEEFQTAIKQSGLKQEDFIIAILSAYNDTHKTTPTVSKEKAQVRSGLEKLRILIEAVIDRSEDQSRQAAEDIVLSKQTSKNEITALEEQLKAQAKTIKSLEKDNKRLSDTAESRESLKDAFEHQRSVWNNEKETLKTKVSENAETITELKKQLTAEKNKNKNVTERLQTLQLQIDTLKHEAATHRKSAEVIAQNLKKQETTWKDKEAHLEKELSTKNTKLQEYKEFKKKHFELAAEIVQLKYKHEMQLKDAELHIQKQINEERRTFEIDKEQSIKEIIKTLILNNVERTDRCGGQE